MKMKVIEFENLNVEVVRKKNVKRARINVYKDDRIRLVLPYLYPKFIVKDFLTTNLEWINSKLKLNASKRLPSDKTRLLGEIYTIEFEDSIKTISFDKKIIKAPNELKFKEFKKEFAKVKYRELIDIYQPLVGREVKRLSIKDMNTRWGSCNSTKGYINLALNLVEKRSALIEYVVLHELTHLLYPHHQKSFYKFIEEIMPDYKKREIELKFG
ncbi:MAG: M48 family metallopeptidase [Campylobacter sp.]|nr:M48 family metallopeptidase [Campylobacter sp.]